MWKSVLFCQSCLKNESGLLRVLRHDAVEWKYSDRLQISATATEPITNTFQHCSHPASHTSRPPKKIVNFRRQFLSCGHRQTHNVKTVQPLQQRKSIGLSVCSRQHGIHSISTELWKCRPIQCMHYSGCSAVRKYLACACEVVMKQQFNNNNVKITL